MRPRIQLEPRDKLLLAILLTSWLVLISLNTRAVVRGTAYSSLAVAEAPEPDGHPTVAGFLPWLGAAESGLRVGDRVLALGKADLRGVGSLGFLVLVSQEAATARSIEVVFERDGERRQATVALGSLRQAWPCLVASTAFAATAVLLLLRARPTAKIRPGFVTLMLVAIYFATTFFAERSDVAYLVIAVRIAALSLFLPIGVRAMYTFADYGRPATRSAHVLPWLLAVGGPVELALLCNVPYARLALVGFAIAAVGSVLLIATSCYRRADQILRRQVRWVVYGFYCAGAPAIAILAVEIVDPKVIPWYTYCHLAFIAVPISIWIAVARYDLFDIDRVISTTGSYNIVLVAIAAAGFAIIPAASAKAASVLDIDPPVGHVVFAAFAAAVVIPLQRRLRPRLERRFFPERYAIDRGIERLLIDLSQQRDAKALLVCCGEGLSRLLCLDSCAIFWRRNESYGCVFTHEAKRFADFDGDSPLIAALRPQRAPLSLGSHGDRNPSGIDPFAKAALESLDAEVVLPIHCADQLTAFIELGGKGSGDVYTTTDLRLLAEVANRMSTLLDQLDRQRRAASSAFLLPRKFELIEKVGQGGMGTVFKVRHLTLDMIVAVKILPEQLAADPEFVQRFHREAHLMAQLRHPNIVRVMDVDTERGLHYLVMEFVVGRTVSDVLREDGPFSLRRTLEIAIQVGEALQYAHAHDPPVVHRDISPSNILAENGTGRAVVTDFGVAKVLGAKHALTRTGDFIGKLRYASPEHLRGDSDLDGRADIYALGMVIHEMFEGRSFFARCDDGEVLRRVMYDPGELVPELLRDAPKRLTEIIARAIAKDRGRRYATAGDLVRDLRSLRDSDCSASVATSETGESTPEERSDEAKRTRLAVTAKTSAR